METRNNLELFTKLPADLVKYILPFDNRFIVRNNQIKNINKIAKDDYRYEILQIHIPNKKSNGCKVFWITIT